jgi:hypothetical protein
MRPLGARKSESSYAAKLRQRSKRARDRRRAQR